MLEEKLIDNKFEVYTSGGGFVSIHNIHTHHMSCIDSQSIRSIEIDQDGDLWRVYIVSDYNFISKTITSYVYYFRKYEDAKRLIDNLKGVIVDAREAYKTNVSLL